MFKTDKAPAGSPVGAGNLRELLAPEKAQALKPRIDFRRLPGVQSSLTEAECRGFFAGFGGSTYYLRCETECEVPSVACEVRSARQFNHSLMMVNASAAQALACSWLSRPYTCRRVATAGMIALRCLNQLNR